MMRIMALMLTVLTGATLAGEPAAGFPARGDLSSAVHRQLEYDGLGHEYLIQPVAGPGLHPAVIILHGGTQSAKQI